jgi:hypothetical protein
LRVGFPTRTFRIPKKAGDELDNEDDIRRVASSPQKTGVLGIRLSISLELWVPVTKPELCTKLPLITLNASKRKELRGNLDGRYWFVQSREPNSRVTLRIHVVP